MDDQDALARRFDADRTHLRAVAYRLLGSVPEADDAVQETWLRLNRVAAGEIDNLSGWLTTVVARVSLDLLRARTSRREDPLDDAAEPPAPAAAGGEAAADPEDEAVLADSMGAALLVVLETLAPPERLAFVLHDLFAMPFDEIAPIVGRSPAATRQLASRGRRRVRGADPAGRDHARQRAIVDAFLAASRGGDFAALLELLDPDAILRADDAAVRSGAVAEVRGATAVAQTFTGRAQAARPALVDGSPGAVWSHRGQVRVVFDFTITDGRIRAIDLIADPDHVGRLDLASTHP